MADPRPTEPSPTPGAPVRWGAFLACSWTWCIGMFLPILMLRDYGWAGLAVFLIPNAIGAAAMGWLLPGAPDLARRFAPHMPMIRWFTRITVAFHLFWIGVLASPLVPAFPGAWLALPLATIGGALLGIRRVTEHGPAVAATLWVLGLGLVVALVATLGVPDISAFGDGQRPHDALLAAPVVVLGFLACPYLDATFLLARHANRDEHARGAFTLGFLAMFPVMIAATVLYGPLLAGAATDGSLTEGAHGWLGLAIAMHLALQAGFTIAVHTRSLDRLAMIWPAPTARLPSPGLRSAIGARPAPASSLLWLVPIGLAGMIAGRMTAPGWLDMSIAEVGYRVFLGCYGLLFPAYVWICVIGRDRRVGTGRPNRRNLLMTAVATALGAPCFFMGFVMFEAWWLVAGGAVLLLARAGRSAQGEDQPPRRSLAFGDT